MGSEKLTRFRIPVRVSVAPVQTYKKVITVDAIDRRAAAALVREQISARIDEPGWKSVGGRLEALRPDHTIYDTYLDERALDEWAASPSNPEPSNDP